jgi:SAM-dependent methyltransferase
VTVPEYDLHDLATPYRRSKDLPFRVASEVPDHMALLGDLRGLSVLDLACGEGFYTRRIQRAGAARVVGVDLAESMIATARAQEGREPLGISYVVADAGQLPDSLGTFDIVSAAFLLCNAPDRATLGTIAAAIARALRPGGRFVGTESVFGLNPGIDYRAFGMSAGVPRPLPDGASYPLTFHLDDGSEFTLTNFAWSRETWEATLRDAGLAEIRWHTPTVTPDGRAAFGDDFWRTYLEHPPILRLEARRPRS